MHVPEPSRHRIVTWICLVVALLWPVLVYGYPLFFYDSTDYLAVGAGSALGTQRPPAYGYAIRLLHWNRSPWPIVAGQATLAAWLLWRTLDALRIPRGLRRIAVAAVVAATSLPFFVVGVMPDVLTGLLALGAFVAVARPPRHPVERALLAALLVGGAAAHITHLPLLLGFGVLLFVAASVWRGLGLSRVSALGVMAAPVLAAGLLLGANLAVYGVARFAYSSPVMALGRLIGDGLAQRTLAVECPARPWRICAERGALDGVTADWFMWDPESPLNTMLGGMVGYAPEAAEVVGATLRQHWPEALSVGFRRAGELLLLHTGASDAHGAEAQAYALRDLPQIGFAAWAEGIASSRLIQAPGVDAVATLGDLACFAWGPLLILAGALTLRRRSPFAALFVALSFAAILGNALVVGMGGEVHGRYHGRVAWLAALACAAAALSGTARPALGRAGQDDGNQGQQK